MTLELCRVESCVPCRVTLYTYRGALQIRWRVISLHISIFMCNHIITVGDGGGGGGGEWDGGANGLNPGKTP